MNNIKKYFNLILSIILVIFVISCEDTNEPNDDNNNNNDGTSPIITELSNTPTYAGYPIEIYGDRFGFSESGNSVKLNGNIVSEIIFWSYTKIIVKLPNDANTGEIVVTTNGSNSNAMNIVINEPSTDEAPKINAFDNNKPFTRSAIGIEGKNFGDEQGESFVVFNGIIATEYSSWRDRKIVAYIPSDVKTGDVVVYVNGQMSNAVTLQIQEEHYLLEQVEIPAGEFMMGSEEPADWADPVHKVRLTQSFMMSKYEITQQNWEDAVFGQPHNSYHVGPNFPVERVSWIQACEFCNALSKRERFEEVYTIDGEDVSIKWEANGYRLPTEAEWEWAARAGSDWKYGKDSDGDDARVNDVSWHNENSQNATHEVGTRKANAYGLYDMLGNVDEWCWDYYDADYFTECGELIVNPKGSTVEDAGRIKRGGNYTIDKLKTNVFYRVSANQTISGEFYNGFRVVRNIR